MGNLVEIVHVCLGGHIDPLDWAFPYLDDEFVAYSGAQLATEFIARREAHQRVDRSTVVDTLRWVDMRSG